MKRNNKFISSFVNAMYSILIGIGVGNIIFQGDFNLKSIPTVIMTLFVTGVVLIYWWDWTEYIEQDTSTTKSELAIDFLLLIALEMLFAYYNKPKELSRVFLSIGIIDLIWVINHVLELMRENKNYILNQKKWIVEKILCISIYITSFVLVNYLLTNTYTQFGLIIFTFIVIRRIGFINIKKIKKLMFCKASMDDINSIVELNNQYFDDNSNVHEDYNRGFLIHKYTYKEIRRNIEEELCKLYISKDSSNNILGYIQLQSTIETDIINDVTWVNDNIKKMISNTNYLYITQIAVKKDLRGNGIGKFLYNSLYEKYPLSHFLSFVMTNPVENRASIKFHESNKFEVIGLFRRNNFCGFNDYKSFFYYKKPEKLTAYRHIHIE